MPRIPEPRGTEEAGDARAPWLPARPENVGIWATEVYFPSTFVTHESLELYDRAPAGKYTLGLGQRGLAFCHDREDAVSMALSALWRLLRVHSVDPSSVGFLACGSESGPDAAKSIRTHLLPLFSPAGGLDSPGGGVAGSGGGGGSGGSGGQPSGQPGGGSDPFAGPPGTDLAGSEHVQACHGGTAAVMAAMDWMDSRSWDGRLAVVVASDVAAYAPGPARATSGAGAVAILLGPDAPLVADPYLRQHYGQHRWDFFKPSGLFPAVDGPLSVYCYLSALDECYEGILRKENLRRKWQNVRRVAAPQRAQPLPAGLAPAEAEASPARQAPEGQAGRPPARLADWSHVIFHAPYNKLVRKAFARLSYLDAFAAGEGVPGADGAADPPGGGAGAQAGGVPAASPGGGGRERRPDGEAAGLPPPGGATGAPPGAPPPRAATAASRPLAASCVPRSLESSLVAAATAAYEAAVEPSTLLQRQCGNAYCASVWMGLAQLVEARGAALVGKKILLFSYGSGATATMLSFTGREPTGGEAGGWYPGRAASGGGWAPEALPGASAERQAALAPASAPSSVPRCAPAPPSFSLSALSKRSSLAVRLAARDARPPSEFVGALERAERLAGTRGWKSSAPALDDLKPGTFYLDRVDDRFRRWYQQVA